MQTPSHIKAILVYQVMSQILTEELPALQAINEAGGSLLLAVLNGQLSYPNPDVYPSELQGVIQACLTVSPAKRPYVEDVRAMVQDLLVRCPNEHRLP